MKHEELLTEVNRRLEVALYNGDPQSIHALRAVVELHSYIIYKNTETDEMYEQCHECSGNGYHQLYPCPTIRAIEEELA